MSLSNYSFTALITTNVDGGNTITGQSVTVKIKSSGALAALFSDEAGANPISNPALTDINGVLSFFVASDSYILESGGRTEIVDIGLTRVLGINAQTGTAYTIVAADSGKIVTLDNAATITVTVPSGLDVGFNCELAQKGDGKVTLSPSGTTLNSADAGLSSRSKFSLISIQSDVVNNFFVGGDLSKQPLIDRIASDAPIAHWPMGESSGNLTDVINGNNLVSTNLNYSQPSLAPSTDSTSIDWDNGVAVGTHPTLRISGVVTIACLVRFDTLNATSWVIIEGIRGSSAEADNILFQLRLSDNTGGKMAAFHQSGSGVGHTSLFTDFSFNIDTNYFVHVVRDTTNKKWSLFVNGVLKQELGYSANPTGGGNATTNVGGPSDGHFQGNMQFLAIYDRDIGATARLAQVASSGL